MDKQDVNEFTKMMDSAEDVPLAAEIAITRSTSKGVNISRMVFALQIVS